MDIQATMLSDELITLDRLPAGRGGRITRLDMKPADSQRLMEMGLTVGARVQVIKLAPLGDPLEIVVRGSHLSVRRSAARSIVVDPQG